MKRIFLFLGGIILLFLFFLYSPMARDFFIGINPYLVINDTDEVVKGSVLGSTSPSIPISIEAHSYKWINFSHTEPQYFKTSNGGDVGDVNNYIIFKVIRVSDFKNKTP